VYGQEYSDAYLASKSYDYLSLLYSLKIKDTLTAKKIARTTISKAKETTDYTHIGMGYEQLARVSRKEEALIFLDSCVHYSVNSSHRDYPANGYLYKSYLQFYDGTYLESLQSAILGYQSAKKKRNEEQQVVALNTISAINRLWGNYQKSLETDFLTFKLIKDTQTEEGLNNYFNTLKNIGANYVQLKQPDDALHYYNIGIEKAMAVNDSIAYYDFVSKTAAPLLLKNRLRSAKDSLLKGDAYRAFFDARYPRYYTINLGKYHITSGDKSRGVQLLKQIDETYEKDSVIQPELPEVYELLLTHYKDNNDTKKQLEYLYKLNEISTIIAKRKDNIKAETNNGYFIPKLVEDKEEEITNLKTLNENWSKKIWWIIGLLGLTIIGLFYYMERQQTYKKRFERLRSVQQTPLAKLKHESQKTDISSEIIDAVLKQLTIFQEKQNFRNKELTLNKVAKSFDTNSTYLSKIINLKKDKNFSQYINELRVDFAINELNINPKFRKYTIKAIAEESGFKSGESFSKAFYKKFKIYPSYYLKQLDK
jgi:AraC-like DNA-binding protein